MYERPLVIKNDTLAEGVYMDSGSDCWSVSHASVQPWNGAHHVFAIHARHSRGAQHISSNCSYVITFSDIITSAYSEFGDAACTVRGNQVIIDRRSLADAYQSGDVVQFKVFASAGDQAKTEALNIVKINWECTHLTNVQGVLD